MTTRKHIKLNSNGGGQTVGAATFQLAYSASSLGIDNVGFRMECTLVGQHSDGRVVTVQMTAVFRVVSGTFTQYGTTVKIYNGDFSMTSLITPNLDVSGGTAVRFSILGYTGATINWMPWIDIYTGEI